MAKRATRILTVIMVISMMMSLFGLGAYAQETAPDVQAEPDLYIYKYDGNRYHNGIRSQDSSYLLSFRWMRPDGTPAENWRTYDISTGLFNLVTTDGSNQSFAAYCADFLYSAHAETTYKRLNLEDAGYFSPAAAAHIRGILNNGYWHTWTDADLAAAESAANAWLSANTGGSYFAGDVFVPGDINEEVSPISGLTVDEAITATQMAIWAFANTESDNWWMDFKEYGTDAEDVSNNIKAFRKYLIHQQAQPASAGSIIFSDEAVSSSAVFSTAGEGISYDVTMYFKLIADVAQNIDNLTLTAVLGAGTEGQQVITAPLTGADALVPDADGFYKITFSGVTDANLIEVTVSGTQDVNDVYFYQAKAETGSARTESQNMVGFASGQTPVTAESEVDFELGSASVSLFKYDATEEQEEQKDEPAELAVPAEPVNLQEPAVPVNPAPALPAEPAEGGDSPLGGEVPAEADPLVPLAGAEFDLYAMVGNNALLVKSGLVSGEDGMIQVDGLADGYRYFFREVKAPEGYDRVEGDFYAGEQSVNVGNVKTPDVPDVPDTPDVPDVPDVPDTPDVPDVPDVPDTPDVPDVPDTPDVPDIPYIPDIPDIPDVPDVPDVPETPDTPDDTSEIVIEDPETPLDEGPGADEELVEIEEEVPLANVPKTGDSSWIWYSLTIISGLALAAMNIAGRREKRNHAE